MRPHQILMGVVFLLTLCLAPLNAFAAAPECGTDVECVCTQEKMPDATYFPEIRNRVIDIRRMLCLDRSPREEIYRSFSSFALTFNGQWFRKYGGFKDSRDPLQEVLDIAEETIEGEKYLVAALSLIAGGVIEVRGEFFEPASPISCPEQDCRSVLQEFEQYYGHAQTTLASAGAINALNRISRLGGQWDQYLEQSRSQTPLELAFNSWNFQRRQTTEFSSPPRWQAILLHPALVIENVEDAVEGEKTEEALMIELIGMNRWKAAKWYQPTGGSIVAVYADRVDTDDVGYGIALHFNSTYTIGYTERDGKPGFFVSLDLLKPLQNGTNIISKYTH